MNISETLDAIDADKQFDNYLKKYKSKKIVLYGVGSLFFEIKDRYNLSELNIIAVADKRFEHIKEPEFNEEIGFKVISPLYIHNLNPDLVMLTVYPVFYLEKYICENLFLETGKKFRYRPFFKVPFAQEYNQCFLNFMFGITLT